MSKKNGCYFFLLLEKKNQQCFVYMFNDKKKTEQEKTIRYTLVMRRDRIESVREIEIGK